MKCSCGKRENHPGKAKFTENGFEHILSFAPGFECEKWKADPNDGSNHGCGCVDMLWIVRNESGAVQFRTFTGWYPSWKEQRYGRASANTTPFPYDLGYHSPKPMYEDQHSMGECGWLGSKDCYYDGSGLNAEKPFTILVTEGESALWKFLEEYHKETFASKLTPGEQWAQIRTGVVP
jgi:hypothetical protein